MHLSARLAQIAELEESAAARLAAADALRTPWERRLLAFAREQEASRCDLIAARVEADVAAGVETEERALEVLCAVGLNETQARRVMARRDG